MKLRLPRHLVLAFVLAGGALPGVAAIRHSDVSLNTYVDFATNSGRYVTGATNELLEYIRTRDGGVTIQYTGGQATQTLPNGMISFDSVADLGNATLTGYNYVVTVAHNGTLNPTFGGNKQGVGQENALVYKGIEELSNNNSFVNSPEKADYKLTRLSKIVTDAESASIYSPAYTGGSMNMSGTLVYRVGGGDQTLKDYEGKSVSVSSAGVYTVAGVGTIKSWSNDAAIGSLEDIKTAEILGKGSWDSSGVSSATPLPFGSAEGDSGSPYFAWNPETKQFELLLAHTGSYNSGERPLATAAPEWTKAALEANHVRVDMSRVSGELFINGAEASDDKGGVADVINGTSFTALPAKGYLADTNGNLYDENWNSVAFNGVETDTHTWKSLSGLKDSQQWYAYGNEYLNASESVIVVDKVAQVNEGLTYAELYMTQNLVFEGAANQARYTINVTRDTDLGVGYLQFSAEKVSGVQFDVKSDSGKQLDSAGYVVDVGVQVNVSLRNADADYMREWRKVGEGTLNICGKGNNEIFLNVGGAGRTLLNQDDGYAAYNVLTNTGSVVVIKNTSQIKRDFTFGSGGGVLDMNGNQMDWYTTGGEKREGGFTINALTEEAVITNSSSQHAALIYKESGDTVFAGSFRDTADSSLGITYAVDGGTWELNGIRTSLTHKDSGLTVEKGTVKLSGTLTVHGYGSSNTMTSADFSTREKDWHYADATMNVTVKDGATFELESHARLTGKVTVEDGGKYIMHEGVQYAEEYIEGGEQLESTADIAAYYGHKGDVSLEGKGSLTWKRGSKEVATLKVNSAGLAEMSKVESAISSETQLRLAAAKGETGRLSAALLALKSGVSLELCGLYIDAASTVSAEAGAHVSLQESTLELSSANTCMNNISLDSALTFSFCGDAAAELYLTAGTEVLDIETGMFSGAFTLSCDQLVFDLRGLEMPGDGVFRISFGDDVQFADSEHLSVAALTSAGQTVGYYSASQVGYIYFIVPEPATATLSLLALSALAARRRRR